MPEDAPLKCCLLGTVRVQDGRHTVDQFRSHRAVALLIYLVSQNHPVPRSELVELIWPDKSEERGRANLRWALSYWNKLLPDCWETTRQTVQFQPGKTCQVDLLALRQALASEDVEKLATAVADVQGDFCRGFYVDESPEFETWLLTQREHWQQQLQTAYRRLIDHFSRRGDYGRALTYARELLAQDSWQESVHRQMMLLLARSGDFNGALAQYEACCQILADELHISPTQPTIDLAERIRVLRNRPRHNLPAQPTQFIGRESELKELTALLSNSENRLVTIVAPGGMGKTRLALAAASQQISSFLEGVAFVSLASTDSSAMLATTIVETLSNDGFIEPQKGHKGAADYLLDELADKELLLLLDNYEQLLPDIALLLSILDRAPQVKLLITSRERLNTRWERPYPVSGLPFSTSVDAPDWQDYRSVQLFLQTAQQVRPGFRPTDDERQAISQICQLVEGMPLALELAATWVRIQSPAAIAAEIADNLSVLHTRQQDMPTRQRSIHAVFDQTWARLTLPERKVLAQLSVFRGSFTFEAAHDVTGAGWQIIASLIDKSLLRQQQMDADSSNHYAMHELLRQYAAEQLVNDFDPIETSKRHGSYYAQLAATYEPALAGGIEVKTTLQEMRREIDNIRAAWEWALSTKHGECVNQMLHSIYLFYWHPSLVRDGLAVMAAAAGQLEAVKDENETLQFAYGRVLTRQGAFTWLLHEDYETAEYLLCQSLEILHDQQPAVEYALALNFLANTIYTKDLATARQYWLQSLTIYEEAGNEERQATLLRNLCVTAPTYPEFVAYWEQSVARQDQRNESHLYFIRAERDIEAGYVQEAEAFARKSVESILTLDDPPHLILALNVLNKILIAQNKLSEARANVQEMQKIAAKLSITWHSLLVQIAAGILALAENRHDEAEAIFEQVADSAPDEGSYCWLRHRSHFYLGGLYLQKGNYDVARKHWQGCTTWADLPGFLTDCFRWRTMLGIGETWLHEGDVKTAVVNLQQARDLALTIGCDAAWEQEFARLLNCFSDQLQEFSGLLSVSHFE